MNSKGSKTKVGQDKSEIVEAIPMACADEQSAVEFLEKQRWCDKPECPCCGSHDVYQMQNSKTGERQKNNRWRCRECKKQYTVRIGTVMEDSRIPLRHWCYAFWRACTSKKGVSALEIKRHTGLSYKSALFLMHRIRFAMAPTDQGPKLAGTVEADETYVGGKPRYSHARLPKKFGANAPSNYRTRKERHTPVFGAVCRETGEVRARVIADVKAHNLKAACNELIDKSSDLITDEHRGYIGVGKEYASHEAVKHSMGQYVRPGGITTNTIESFWSLLKRGVIGTFHNVSRKHLQRYVDEFEFRYNHRKLEDGERVVAAIAGAQGKRLVYRGPVDEAV
ncbi:MAG: IS1595 family transposase [Planctomycetota bacterium]